MKSPERAPILFHHAVKDRRANSVEQEHGLARDRDEFMGACDSAEVLPEMFSVMNLSVTDCNVRTPIRKTPVASAPPHPQESIGSAFSSASVVSSSINSFEMPNYKRSSPPRLPMSPCFSESGIKTPDNKAILVPRASSSNMYRTPVFQHFLPAIAPSQPVRPQKSFIEEVPMKEALSKGPSVVSLPCLLDDTDPPPDLQLRPRFKSSPMLHSLLLEALDPSPRNLTPPR